MSHAQQTLETQDVAGPATAPSAAPDDLRSSREVLEDLFGPVNGRFFSVRFWDGTLDEPRRGSRFTLVLHRRGALRRMLWPPSELALGESFVYGDVDVEGDMEAASELADVAVSRIGSLGALFRLVRRVAALPKDDDGRDARAPRERPRLRRFGRQHSVARDRQAVRFHYDVGNPFYSLWLDRQMVYSCGYFPRGDEDLDTAQTAKLDLICRKLRLSAGERLLDIGCGWGALLLHAAKRYGAIAVGITLSEPQAAYARERIAASGLEARCRVEVRDYRQLQGHAPFDKVSSVGMVEHVGPKRLDEYFASAFAALRPGGLFLNHGIVSIDESRPRSVRERVGARLWRRGQFIDRYVFPDGALPPIASIVSSAERAGFELRDAESLRDHYLTTLRHWIRRLEARSREAVELVGDATYRVWRLYMAASAHGFRTGRIGIVQSLLAKARSDGRVEVPRSREDLYRRS